MMITPRMTCRKIIYVITPLLFLLSIAPAFTQETTKTATATAGPVGLPSLQTVIDGQAAGIAADADDDQVLAALRQRCKERPPLPLYEHNPSKDPVKEAEKLLQQGWTTISYPPVKMDVPFAWGVDRFGDKEWVANLVGFHHVDILLQAWQVSGNRKYFDAAAGLMADYIDYALVRQQDIPYHMLWHDITTGERGMFLAYLLDQALRLPDVPVQMQKTLVFGAQIHAQYLAQHITPSNHGMFQCGALGLLCRVLPEMRGAAANRRIVDSSMLKVLYSIYNQEGMELEHSPYYHIWVFSRLERILKLNIFSAAVQQECDTVMNKARENFVLLFHPNGALSKIGDSDNERLEHFAGFHPYIDYVLSGGKQGKPYPQADNVFPQTGYAIFQSPWTTPRDQASYLFLTACFHGYSHKTADDFSFEWCERGKDLLVDSGKYAYYPTNKPDDFKSRARAYVISTRAHNTVEIDGKDYTIDPKQKWGSAIRRWGESGGISWVEASLDRSEFGVQHRRWVLLNKGQWLLVMDELTSLQPHDYVQWFHFNSEGKVATEPGGVAAFTLPGLSEKVYVLDLAGTAESQQLVVGQEKPLMQGWQSRDYFKIEPAYALGLAAHGTQKRFVTLLSLASAQDGAPGDGQVSVKENHYELSWKMTGSGQQQTLDIDDASTQGLQLKLR